MHAKYLQDGTIAVSGTVREERFTRIWAGIGWPDRDAGYLCVVGEREDGRYHALSEYSGGLSELARAAIEVKDRLLVENVWVDGRDAVATSFLRTLDGLCGYQDTPKTRPNPVGCGDQREPHHPESSSTDAVPPHGMRAHHILRNRPYTHEEHAAIVVAVPDRITSNFRSALEKTRGVIMASQLLIHQTRCPKLIYTLRQPLDEILKSPVMKALVWVITALEDHKENDTPPEDRPVPWYGNLPRGPV
jgi:hypothetical protein